VKTISSKLKTLPLKTKKYLGLAIVFVLLITLVLFVWALLTQRLDLRKRASTGEPVVQTPITWVTPSIRITADDFYIMSNGKTYTGRLSEVNIHEEQLAVQNEGRSSIIVRSTKYGDNLKLRINFRTDKLTTWYVYSVQVFNSNYADRWVTYTSWPIETQLGYPYRFDGEYDFGLIDPHTNLKIADVHFNNLSIQGFTDINPNPTPTPLIANECELCGGFAGIGCAAGLTCLMQTGNYPDQSGICVNPDGSSQCTSPSPTPFPTASPSPEPIPGDINEDGHVNIVDIGIIIDNYRMTVPDDPRADINGDGIVNIVDVGIIIDNYGR